MIIQAEGVFDSTAVEEFIESAPDAIDNCTVKTLFHLCGISYMSSIRISSIDAINFELHPRESKREDISHARGKRRLIK